MSQHGASTVREVVNGAVGPLSGGAALLSLAEQLQRMEAAAQAAAETTKENTKAVEASTNARGSGSGSVLGAVGTTVEGVVGSGLGLSPLLTGLLSLFGGGGGASEPPPALVRFALPAALNATAGVSDAAPGRTFPVDYGQGGTERPVAADRHASAIPTQITVQVQAMDSQSFLDHSNDIALAVRRAMLESSVLNDVIREI